MSASNVSETWNDKLYIIMVYGTWVHEYYVNVFSTDQEATATILKFELTCMSAQQWDTLCACGQQTELISYMQRVLGNSAESSACLGDMTLDLGAAMCDSFCLNSANKSAVSIPYQLCHMYLCDVMDILADVHSMTSNVHFLVLASVKPKLVVLRRRYA
jgi:hypothetical protein